MPEPPPKRVEITISVRTMATILAVVAFVWAFVAARQAVLWVFIALFLAIVLQTPVTWLEERGRMRRGNAAMVVVLGVMGFLGLLSYLLISPFVGAVRDLIEDLPTIVERIRASDLFQQIDAIQPKVIVALGKFGAQTLLRTLDPISRLRGRVFDFRGAKLVPTFHPAYLLRNPASKREVWEDMKLVRRLLTGSTE